MPLFPFHGSLFSSISCRADLCSAGVKVQQRSRSTEFIISCRSDCRSDCWLQTAASRKTGFKLIVSWQILQEPTARSFTFLVSANRARRNSWGHLIWLRTLNLTEVSVLAGQTEVELDFFMVLGCGVVSFCEKVHLNVFNVEKINQSCRSFLQIYRAVCTFGYQSSRSTSNLIYTTTRLQSHFCFRLKLMLLLSDVIGVTIS